MDLLVNSADLIPDNLPFSSTIKKMTKAIANESQGNVKVQILLLSNSVCTVRGFLDRGQLHYKKCALIS